MALPDLRVRIGADTGQLDRAIGATQGKLKDFARNVAITVGGALTIGLVRDTLRATAQLDNLSKLAGISVERFQELAIGVRQFGVEQDKLADILKDVNDKFGDYMQTGAGPLADFFEKIAPQVGLTAAQFADLSSEQKLGAYIDALRRANVAQDDMTFYMEALANDATILVGAFEDNAAAMQGMIDKAREMGIILDEQAIAKAKEANAQFDLMTTVIGQNLKTAIIELGPILVTVTEQIANLTSAVRGFFEPIIEFNRMSGDLDAAANRLFQNRPPATLPTTVIDGPPSLGPPGSMTLEEAFNARMQQAIDRALMENPAGFSPADPSPGFQPPGGILRPPMRPEQVKEVAKAAASAAKSLEVVDLTSAKVETSLNSIGQAAKNAFVNFVTGAQNARQAVSQLVASLAAMAAEKAFMSLFGNFGPFRAATAGGVPIPPPRPSFFGGGYTGSGPRSGGIDGRGGFPAILHPNETVIDHTRGGAAGMVRVIVEEAPGFATRVRTEAQGVAVQVVQAGIQQYDRLVAPATQRRVAADPRRVG